MTSYDSDGRAGDAATLDPAAERLRRKLARLLFVSGGIMIAGLIAVFAAIVYKLNAAGEGRGNRLTTASPVEGRVAIPSGFRLVGTALDGDRALLTIAAADGTTSLLLVDLTSGAIVGRYAVGSK